METDDSGYPITDINVTPLVDVSLVLVIIFMAVAPFTIQAGIKAAETREGEAKGKASQSENVVLEIDAEGSIKVNGTDISLNRIAIVLEKAILESKDKLVTLKAAETVEVRQVVDMLDLSKQRGAKKLVIMGSENLLENSKKP